MSHFHIELITNKVQWEEFIRSRPEANFLHSWNWGVFHQALGKKVFYFGLFEADQQIGAALLVKETAKRGTYLTLAGGPILDWNNRPLPVFLFDELKKISKQESAWFIRMRPQAIETPAITKTVQTLGWQPSPMHLTADLTLQLDLNQSTEHLLAQMRKSTRYEIKKAEKLGILVKLSQDEKDIQMFYDHQLELAKKHHFVGFSYRFFQEQFNAFVTDNQVVLFHSYLNDQLLASAFVIFYNQEAVYHYGISTPANQRLPGSYACQWAAIQEAQRRGFDRYNFWGIAPVDHTDHRFAGVSLFKRGFGGQEIQYLPAHDLPTSWKYTLVKGFETVRRKMRHL